MKLSRFVLTTMVLAILVSMGSVASAYSDTLYASFSSDIASGAAPLTVHFTDRSPGSPTGWQWDFGDGSSSIRQDPTHTFQTSGEYNVTLTVTDGYESSTTSSPITVTSDPLTTPAPILTPARPIYIIVPAKPGRPDKPGHPDQPKIDKPVKKPDGNKGPIRDPGRNGDHKKRT